MEWDAEMQSETFEVWDQMQAQEAETLTRRDVAAGTGERDPRCLLRVFGTGDEDSVGW